MTTAPLSPLAAAEAARRYFAGERAALVLTLEVVAGAVWEVHGRDGSRFVLYTEAGADRAAADLAELLERRR